MEGICGVMKKLSSSKFGAISYIIKIKWKNIRKRSTWKEVTNCVGILGPIGCNINGGGGTRGMPPN
jgi:hypothetical protein